MTATNRLAILLEGEHVADVERTRRGVMRLTVQGDVPPGSTPLSLALPRSVGGSLAMSSRLT